MKEILKKWCLITLLTIMFSVMVIQECFSQPMQDELKVLTLVSKTGGNIVMAVVNLFDSEENNQKTVVFYISNNEDQRRLGITHWMCKKKYRGEEKTPSFICDLPTDWTKVEAYKQDSYGNLKKIGEVRKKIK